MLVVKRLAGVAPEVNLRNTQHKDEKAHKESIHMEPKADISRGPKQGLSLAHKKDVMSSKIKSMDK